MRRTLETQPSKRRNDAEGLQVNELIQIKAIYFFGYVGQIKCHLARCIPDDRNSHKIN